MKKMLYLLTMLLLCSGCKNHSYSVDKDGCPYVYQERISSDKDYIYHTDKYCEAIKNPLRYMDGRIYRYRQFCPVCTSISDVEEIFELIEKNEEKNKNTSE